MHSSGICPCCEAPTCPHGEVEGGCDCGFFDGENPSYGPGNPDWEFDFIREGNDF